MEFRKKGEDHVGGFPVFEGQVRRKRYRGVVRNTGRWKRLNGGWGGVGNGKEEEEVREHNVGKNGLRVGMHRAFGWGIRRREGRHQEEQEYSME